MIRNMHPFALDYNPSWTFGWLSRGIVDLKRNSSQKLAKESQTNPRLGG
jgi:hypothetical protein